MGEPSSANLWRPFLKLLGLVMILTVAVVLMKIIRLDRLLNFQALKAAVESYGYLAPFMFIGLFSIAPVFFIPVSPFPLAGGLLFGPFWGSLYAYASAMLAAVMIFFLSRFLGRETLAKILRGKFKKLDDFTHQYGLTTVLLIRFSGIPFSLQCYLAGVSRLKFGSYLLGSAIGIAPWTIALSIMGDSLSSHNLKLVSLVIGLLLLIYVILFWAWKKKKNARPDSPDAGEPPCV